MDFFSDMMETKSKDSWRRLTRLIQYTVGAIKKFMEYCIQPPHHRGYQTENLRKSAQDCVVISKGGKKIIHY